MALVPPWPGSVGWASGEARGPEDIRLIYFTYKTDRLIEQTPRESDQKFAARVDEQTAGFIIPGFAEQFKKRREEIRADWPTTQAAQDLKYLRKVREAVQEDLDQAEQDVAESQAEVDNDPDSGVSAITLANYKSLLARLKSRLAVVDTLIRQRERRVRDESH